ncbi:MAG TPA: hypothetical protein VFU53_07600 [Burkholderiales bacterium]|nr:hypothetical protein [Burkholderiales bacterium]
MARFFRLAVALLVFGVVAPATPAHAATVCKTLGADDGLALLARQHAQGPQLLADCREKCTPGAQRELMLFADDIPSPRHLPLVAAADEVASRHAGIFEKLSDLREEDEAGLYWELSL